MAQEPHPYTQGPRWKAPPEPQPKSFLQNTQHRNTCTRCAFRCTQISIQQHKLSPAADSQSSLQANIWRSLPSWSDTAQLWSLDPSCTSPASLQMWALLLPGNLPRCPSQGSVDTQSCASCPASSVSHQAPADHQIKDLPLLLLTPGVQIWTCPSVPAHLQPAAILLGSGTPGQAGTPRQWDREDAAE